MTAPTRCECLTDWRPTIGETVTTVLGTTGTVTGYLPTAQVVEVATEQRLALITVGVSAPPTSYPLESVWPESGHVEGCLSLLVDEFAGMPSVLATAQVPASVLPHVDFGATTKLMCRALGCTSDCVQPRGHAGAHRQVDGWEWGNVDARLAPHARVSVVMRWTERQGKVTADRSCVRVGTLHSVDNGAPMLSVDVPGYGVVVLPRADVKDTLS